MNHTSTPAEVFGKNAKLYQEKFMDTSLYHESLQCFCENLPQKKASILELGCGPGNVTHRLLTINPSFQILGTDISVEMLELAKNNNPAALFQKMDFRDLHKIKTKYDGIVCAFGLPYLNKEEAIKLIHDAAKILNKGGLIYISTMEDDYSKSQVQTGSTGDSLFIHYHQEDYLKSAFENDRLQVIHCSRKKYTDSKGKEVVDLMMVGRI